jgi:hypothetical protein
VTLNTLKRIAPLLAAMCLCSHAADEKLPSSDLDHARLYIDQTRNGVIGATKGLSDAQWKFKPAPDRWSIAEVVEHLVLTQEMVLGPIKEQLAKTPVAENRNTHEIDTLVEARFPDRTFKLQAPEMLQPTGRFTPSAGLERLLRDCATLRDYLESTPDLRQHVVAALPLKLISKGAYDSMDGYEWILAACAHIERHTKQILEVKADPKFPAK